MVVCTDHQSLQSWHKEHVDTPSGPAPRRARWHETFAKFDLSVVYVPGKDNTVADCLSRWAYPAGKAWMDISSHGDAEETEEAKRIIEIEKAMEQEGVKCFVVMANRTDLAKFRGARVQAIREETLEQWMVAPVELVRSVLTGDWSDDYAASEHWNKYWNAVSATGLRGVSPPRGYPALACHSGPPTPSSAAQQLAARSSQRSAAPRSAAQRLAAPPSHSAEFVTEPAALSRASP